MQAGLAGPRVSNNNKAKQVGLIFIHTFPETVITYLSVCVTVMQAGLVGPRVSNNNNNKAKQVGLRMGDCGTTGQ
jgi:hypothetical protein